MKYIIEHMDPEMWEWSSIEYRHAAEAVGKESLMVTNVGDADLARLKGIEARKESVAELGLKRVCVLDPAAELLLEPEDAGKFDYLVFGGILGDYPAKQRTKELVVPGAERRSLGKEQFSTDNAVMVAKLVIEGSHLYDLRFMHDLTIPVEEGEEIILPFKYVVVDGKPFVSEKIVEYVREHGF